MDVLTLSATPIPRTLNMALSGIRDMSAIEEPPCSSRWVPMSRSTEPSATPDSAFFIWAGVRKRLRR